MEENKLNSLAKVVIIGGSAGSLEVLLQVLPALQSIESLVILLIVHRRNSDDNFLEELIRMNILTVELLSNINDEGVKRIGMGAVDLKTKAKAWLAQLNDKGPLTLKVAATEKENALLKSSVETLQKQVESLMAALRVEKPVPHETAEITADDLIDDDDIVEQYKAKFGKAPHHKMKPETIREALK